MREEVSQVRDGLRQALTYPAWRGLNPNMVVTEDSTSLKQVLHSLTGETAVLYIRGHGLPGRDFLESSDHTSTRTVTELVQLLKGNLFQPSFAGKIKVYACYSGKDGQTPNGPSPSFVQQFADKMWEAGYKSCSFFGYVESVSTGLKGDGLHRWALISDRRARDAKVQVKPQRPLASSTGGV
jgi:hypothetical protein